MPPVAPTAVRHQVFAAAVAAYNSNVNRSKALYLLPLTVVSFTSINQFLSDQAVAEVTGKVQRVLENHPKAAQIAAAIHVKIEQNRRERITRVTESGYSAFDNHELSEIPFRTLESMTSSIGNDATANGVEAMLASLVVGAWTAFETLAADLWVAAVNAHPIILADLSGNARGRYAVDKGDRLLGRDPGGPTSDDKFVKLSLLQARGYDVQHKMGDILAERYKFERLSTIRKAYAEAFSKNYSAIDKALGDESLDAVSALRNVIVHSAGVADNDYLLRTAKLSRAPKAAENEPILLDGDVVSNLLGPLLLNVNTLVFAIDDWIANTI